MAAASFEAFAILLLAVVALIGDVAAIDAPAPSPASGANALSSPLAAVLLCTLAALIVGFVRR
ncbi:hypothetical protein HPP92_007469 [Vanilla planifolia]|uniref:Uncharacterized protein n=1 Tax=Vanilla planifolia TaxID=51239 RepID=A0A835RKI1_VANPL|nr:hypothetical protein HPP92_007469 [Vanilla planifolia]